MKHADSSGSKPPSVTSYVGTVSSLAAFILGVNMIREWYPGSFSGLVLLLSGLAGLACWIVGFLIDWLLIHVGLQRSVRSGVWVGAFLGVSLSLIVFHYSEQFILSQTVGFFGTIILVGLAHWLNQRLLSGL